MTVFLLALFNVYHIVASSIFSHVFYLLINCSSLRSASSVCCAINFSPVFIRWWLQFHPSVRPSVCRSVTYQYCVRTAKQIVRIVQLPGDVVIVVVIFRLCLRDLDSITLDMLLDFMSHVNWSAFELIPDLSKDLVVGFFVVFFA